MAEPMKKITIQNATKHYKSQTGIIPALEDVTCDVMEGEFACLVGPSGCGKSTLLWGISGLHDLTKGQVHVSGRPVKGPVPEIGMVFQQATLLPWRTVLQNIQFPLQIKKLNVKQYRDRIDHLLEVTGLRGFEHKYPHELSGGMQQRASIVRCLSFDPDVLLMDEPFGALDAFTRDEMNLLIQKIWEETHKTIVFVTHSIQEAIFLADRVFVMTPRPGKISREIRIPFDRPRDLKITTSPDFIRYVDEVKETIYSHN